MLNWTQSAAPNQALTELDQYLFDEVVPDKPNQLRRATLAHYIVELAGAHDPLPGNTVVWRGVSRLTDIGLDIMIGVKLMGN
jgi:hypothetical protein